MVGGGQQQQVKGIGKGEGVISARVQNTIKSIKEIVGNHSEADIYAALKESDMDPNETAQKLLNQDPFREVKRRRDRKKELQISGPKIMTDIQHAQNNVQKTRSFMPWDRNSRKSGYQRNSSSGTGISQQFRVVRDNRQIQSANKDTELDVSQRPTTSNEDGAANVEQNSSTEILIDDKQSSSKISEDNKPDSEGPHRSGSVHDKETRFQKGQHAIFSAEMQSGSLNTNSKAQRDGQVCSQLPTASVNTKSDVGVYSSSTDPIHFPTTGSRSAGTVGAIRREVGPVGVRRHSSTRLAVQQSSDTSSSADSFRQQSVAYKGNQLSQAPGAESLMSNRSYSNYANRQHQQPIGNQKAVQSNMEWKPKSSQKQSSSSSAIVVVELDSSVAVADSSVGSQIGDMNGLSEKISEVSVSENLHVVIPHHLRVPESERAGLMFGSFGNELVVKDSESLQSNENAVESSDEPSGSQSASVQLGLSEDASADQGLMESKAGLVRSDSPTSATESEQLAPGSMESPNNHIESYPEIGLVQTHSSPYDSTETHHRQGSPSLPSFSVNPTVTFPRLKAYDNQEDVAFYRTTIEDNIHNQGFSSQTEGMSFHIANSSPSTAAMMQQQQSVQQQQQAMAQLYPQLHIPHFPNFVPYRHIFSPVYMPPMAMSNYSNNPAYQHPSTANSYVLMPGGSSHVPSGGMKYAASQYKPVPTGSPTAYGSYTNPAAFAVGPPGTTIGGATALEDVSRIKYKDNNFYIHNPQADASDIWVQTQREIPSLQSPPFYNMSGATPHAAFVPAHAGHASFSAAAAAQPSPVQYQSLYHPPQPASIASPHHIVHQQIPAAIGGNVGIGVAAPGPQVGTYQQPQLGHLNWSPNF